MNQDMKLFVLTGEADPVSPDSKKTVSATLATPTARGLELLANKVVKFLLTTYGSDALNPTYGSRAFTVTQMSRAYLPRFRLEVEKDLERCRVFIKRTEVADSGCPALSRIVLQRIRYAPETDPTRVDIFIEVITIDGQRAPLVLPVTL